MCCFPDAGRLLGNTLRVSGQVFAFTAPADRGPVGVLNRGMVALANRWFRLRQRRFRGYRSFVHDLDVADETIRSVGFEPVQRERTGLIWDLRVYVRPASRDAFASP
jgi:hypothetical protein